MKERRPTIESSIGDARPSLQALRYFVATTRGFRRREQERLAQFLFEVCSLSEFTREEVVSWLQTRAGYIDTYAYRSGDASEYVELLQAIPSHHLARTKDYARLLAVGSGRKALDPSWARRIELEFALDPIVEPPPATSGPRLGFRLELPTG